MLCVQARHAIAVVVPHTTATDMRLVGELDLATVPVLTTLIEQQIATGHLDVHIDLSDLTFCDVCGLRGLLDGHRRLAAAGGRLGAQTVPATPLPAPGAPPARVRRRHPHSMLKPSSRIGCSLGTVGIPCRVCSDEVGEHLDDLGRGGHRRHLGSHLPSCCAERRLAKQTPD